MSSVDKRIIEHPASTELYNDDWFIKDSVVEGTTKISKDNLIDKIGASKIKSIAEDYDSTSTYNKDDFAFYENKLYRCLANNTTGTWDGTKWEEFDLPTALITTAHNIETAEFTIGTYYSADDLVLKDGKLYQCVVFHNATEWKSQFWNVVTIDEMLEYISNSIALEHNQSTVYAVGDLVMHNKALWRCIQAGAGAFVNANWELVTVADLIAEAGQIDDVQVKTTGDYETVVENKIAKIDLSSVTAYGEVPNLPQAIATFKDGADAPMKSLKVAIEPQQDLHGYDAPWVGGAGKNLFNKPNLVMNKAIPLGTTIYGQIFGVTASFKLYGYDENDNEYEVMALSINKNSATTTRAYTRLEISQSALNALGNGNLMVSLSDFTQFEPYSNICPITGYTEANVTRRGNNVWGYGIGLPDVIGTYWGWYIPYNTKATIKLFDKGNSGDITNLYFGFTGNGNNADGGVNWMIRAGVVENTTLETTTQHFISIYQGNQEALDKLFNRFNVMVTVDGQPNSTYEPYNGSTYTQQFKVKINQWDEEWEVGGLNPLNGDTTSENDRIRSKNFSPCKPNMTLFYYIPSDKGNLQIVFYDINKNYLGYYNFTTEHTFTTPNGCYFFKFNTGGNYGTTYNNDISINYPSTDTSYHPNGEVTLTVYGGKDEIVGGELKVDRAIRLVSECTWYGGNGVFYTDSVISSIKHGDGRFDHVISSVYETQNIGSTTPLSDGGISVDASGYVQLKDLRYSTASDFKANMGTTQLVYELVTPITYQLTPTAVKSLLGANNIWADTGDINKAEYQRDATTIINELIARIEALEG